MLTLRINGRERAVQGQLFSKTYDLLLNAMGKQDKSKLGLALHIRDYGDAENNLHLAKELGWVDDAGYVLDDVKLIMDTVVGGVDLEDIQILTDAITVVIPAPATTG